MSKYLLKGEKLTLCCDPAACSYTVTFADKVWTMSESPFVLFSNDTSVPFPLPVCEEVYEPGTSKCVKAVYKGFGESNITVTTKAELELLTDDIYFTLIVEGDKKCEIKKVSFPTPFDFGEGYGDKGELTDKNIPVCYTVLPRMQGCLVPAGMHIGIADGKVFERDSYMPIFGQVRENTGYLAIYETPFDVTYELRYENGGEKVAPLWITSLGHIAYPRKILYRFMENCDYNDLAHSYRSYVKEKGNLVTLKEKVAKNPNISKLFGCPVIHTGIAGHISPDSYYYHKDEPEKNDWYISFYERAEQIKALKEKGLEKAYTHFDGWGNHGYDNLHPSPFPPHEAAGGALGMKHLADTVTSCGFIFGIHDQYRDYYYDAPDFSFDEAVMNADGSHPFCSEWYGGKHTWLCSANAPSYVRKNYNEFKRLGINIEASYLDVFSVVFLDECFSPDHPATREDCAKNRRECLDILTSRGIIPSSEEILDCILPSQVLCHHAPYYTDWLGGSDSNPVGLQIPLFNLVYHDCVVIPWIGKKGSRGGWGITGKDSGYAHANLNGNPIYLSIDADKDTICEAKKVCDMAEKLTHCTMVRHEFLNPNGRIQRTTFSDGTKITVNFDTEEVMVE
ncbi:MAG: hypothetical protein J6Q74_00925 [Clostridia bacterium]|nr:hypothetical protein [Clostridia bacterium]